MQHAVALSGEEDDQVTHTSALTNTESDVSRPTSSEPIKFILSSIWSGIKGLFYLLRPSTIRYGFKQFRQMTFKDLIKGLLTLLIKCMCLLYVILIYALRYVE